MRRLEREAIRAGRTLLTLDTRGRRPRRALYRAMGWIELGRVPGYALKFDGEFEETLFFGNDSISRVLAA